MRKLFLLTLTVVFVSCNKLAPAGFWKGFDNSHIVKNTSDQGPWGGTRVITWRNKAGMYNGEDIISFAKSKGWKLLSTRVIDTLVNKNISIKNDGYKSAGEAELAIYGGNTNSNLSFSGCVNGGCILYEFDSGWTRADEGETVVAEGYVLINANKSRMTMFHSWGE